MSQTSYARNFSQCFSGDLSDSHQNRVSSYLNDTGTNIPAGVMMAHTAAGKAKVISSALQTMAGVAVLSFARLPDDLSGSDAITAATGMNVLEQGSIWVQVEETIAVGDAVYTRVTSDGGSNTQLGRFRNDSDSGKCVLVKGARWLTGGASGAVAELYFDMGVASLPGDEVEIVINHPEVTGDTTTTEFIVRADRSFVVDSVKYYNATGLAQDASNYFNIKLLNGAVVLANWSTLTGAQGTLTADTAVNMVLNATPANLVVLPDGVLKLFLDETGTSDLPAGKMIVHGHYV